jgi:hypothetical protein
MQQYKSRVNEPRNIVIAGAFVVIQTGAEPERQIPPSAMVWPGSKSRANGPKGCLETWEILLSPFRKTRTWETLVEQSPGTSVRDLATEVSKTTKHEKVSRAERKEALETGRGSRSLSIVAIENRETDPRKPVSSQGEGRNTELPLGNTR